MRTESEMLHNTNGLKNLIISGGGTKAKLAQKLNIPVGMVHNWVVGGQTSKNYVERVLKTFPELTLYDIRLDLYNQEHS